MSTLTSDQTDYIRQNSGDTDENNYDVSSDTLQVMFDDPAQGNGDLDNTVFYVLRRRAGIAAIKIAHGSALQVTDQAQQKFDHLMLLLTMWGQITGLGGQALSSGVIDLGLDRDWDDGLVW